ncbi:unnamed protein product [Polarella glacialis]|uniref:SMODS and SLOG-associating 2TM effector domain-containing protein n=1 Tax=Polarella glacialis TaxID=89957 RepID=A0A813E8R5_POLGL|nr:unnamed protein product [Polarella glacialis]
MSAQDLEIAYEAMEASVVVDDKAPLAYAARMAANMAENASLLEDWGGDLEEQKAALARQAEEFQQNEKLYADSSLATLGSAAGVAGQVAEQTGIVPTQLVASYAQGLASSVAGQVAGQTGSVPTQVAASFAQLSGETVNLPGQLAGFAGQAGSVPSQVAANFAQSGETVNLPGQILSSSVQAMLQEGNKSVFTAFDSDLGIGQEAQRFPLPDSWAPSLQMGGMINTYAGGWPVQRPSNSGTTPLIARPNDRPVPVAIPEPSKHSKPAQESPKPGDAPASGAADQEIETMEKKNIEALHQEIETMKVQLLEQLVQDIKYMAPQADAERNCKLMYLTNGQAAKIESSQMAKVASALDLTGVKMVVRFCPSQFGKAWLRSFPNCLGRYPTKKVPEIDKKAMFDVDHQLLMVMREIVLPLVVKCHALVIGSPMCELTAAFAEVAAPVQRQYGDAKNCPFRFLMFGNATEYHLVSKAFAEPKCKTVAAQLRRKCSAWNALSVSAFDNVLKMRFGDDWAYWPEGDVIKTCDYSMILFEGISNGQLNTSGLDRFQNDFVSHLSINLPVIAMMTAGSDRLGYVPAISDHVNRGLPFVLLDSRKRPEMPNLAEFEKYMEEYLEKLHKNGIRDAYNISYLSCVKHILDIQKDAQTHIAKASSAEDKLDSDPASEDKVDKLEKHEWIWEVIQRKKLEVRDYNKYDRKKDGPKATCAEDGPFAPDAYDAEDELVKAVNLVLRHTGREMQYESTQWEDRCRLAIGVLTGTEGWAQFAQELDSNWTRIRSSCFFKFDAARDFCNTHKWMDLTEEPYRNGAKMENGSIQLKIDVALAESLWPEKEDFEKEKEAFIKLLQGQLKFTEGLNRLSRSEEAFTSQNNLWLAVHDVLNRDNVYACNIHNRNQVDKVLHKVARIDRLPKGNTLETMILLRWAWNLVDIFDEHAFRYKMVSKAAYLVLLLIGIAVVVITVAAQFAGDPLQVQGKGTQGSILLGLTLAATLVTGMSQIVDPQSKWIKLRGGVLTLESEIWKFRTRIGSYDAEGSSRNLLGRLQAERNCEAAFKDRVLIVQEGVLNAFGLKATSLFSIPTAIDDMSEDHNLQAVEPQKVGRMRFVWNELVSCACCTTSSHLSRVYRFGNHGQFKTCPGFSRSPLQGKDTHHAPAQPNEYVRFRISPAIAFYQSRIPRYSFRRKVFQGSLLLSTIISALLAAISMPFFCAMISCVSAALAAWQDFVGLPKKLDRYSTAASTLTNLLIWWQSLPEYERSVMENVQFLVEETEKTLAGERNAWLSDAETSAKKVKANISQKNSQVEEGDAA